MILGTSYENAEELTLRLQLTQAEAVLSEASVLAFCADDGRPQHELDADVSAARDEVDRLRDLIDEGRP